VGAVTVKLCRPDGVGLGIMCVAMAGRKSTFQEKRNDKSALTLSVNPLITLKRVLIATAW
jgi:hypothetical protein